MIRLLLALPLCMAAPNPQVGGGDFISRRPYLEHVISQIDWRREGKKSTIYMTSTGNLTSPGKFKLVSKTSPMQPNFPLDILSGKGNTVPRAIWLMEKRSNCRGTVLPKAWLPHQIARRQFFTSLNLPRAVWFPVRGLYTKQSSSAWGRDLCVVYFYRTQVQS